VCETMARVQTRPALLKLLGCPLSPTQLIQLRRRPRRTYTLPCAWRCC